MPLTGEYEPSVWGPVADQVALFEATDGREGSDFDGGPCIIVTTVGAKSGKLRKSPLIRVEHEGQYAVVASMGGAPNHPVWYHNIVANPLVMLQDGRARRDYLAHEATGEEKTLWWGRATAVWPAYDAYQSSTERVIPLFVLVPQE
jgi:deazaflavin-dependent oxidoreductase (nitroreductase family)